MEKFTRVELAWMIGAIQLTQRYYEQVIVRSNDKLECAFAHQTSENLASVIAKLERIYANEDKRIEID